MVIGVTDRIAVNELNAIASDPDDENVLLVGDFEGLFEIVSDIAKFACAKRKYTLCHLPIS